MDKEERQAKRKKETQAAAVTLLVFLAIVAVVLAIGIFASSKVIGPKVQKTAEDPVSTETAAVATEITEEPATEQVDPLLLQAQQTVSGMTLEQKVAQMFMVTPDALTGVDGVTAAGETTKNSYTQYPVGGLIYMAKNLTGTDQTTEMLSNMKAYSQEITGLPVFLGVDEEGGTVARIASNSAFGVTDVGNMSDIGATGDAQNAYNVGSTIGAYLNTLGFNMDFAPVADVLSNPDNTVVKDRSFGSDAQLVADMACQELLGLKEYGILGVVKHFPGHGATTEDSHDGMATVDKSLEELQANELVPFQKAIDNGAQVIMVGHISVPQVTGDDTPSSLSSVMVTNVLREQMGFDGIVITDALNMGAVAERYTSAEAAVAAVNAGVDIILMPEDFNAAYQAVLDAVADGTISEERINESVVRIVKVKLGM